MAGPSGRHARRPAQLFPGGRTGRRPGGFASATYTNGIEFGRSAEIEDLFVLGPYRGLGVGRALFEAMLAWARDAGAAMAIVVLTPTGQADGGLAAFYDAWGFAQSDRRIRYLAL